jgi:NAD(P)-dependent dehydrogenase (short-subunit alcohol dehydrogenase family)|tara:strand:+ start:64769 stop:65365 length:597 start_codon:yes stop_codon:yes gene_type:complete
MKNVLITGNRDYGLCKSICNLFDTVDDINYTTVSRSNGWNLDVGPEQKRLADYFVDNKFDIFINNSAIWKFHQIMIAEQVYAKCVEEKHSAHFIHMGSTADTGVKGRTWRYPTEKKALRDYNRDLTYMTMGGSNIKTTCLSPGSLTTPSVMKKHPDRKFLDTEYVADLILWLINQPDYVNINEISVDPIQAGIYARER